MKKIGDKAWDIPLRSPVAEDDYNGRLIGWRKTVAAIADK